MLICQLPSHPRDRTQLPYGGGGGRGAGVKACIIGFGFQYFLEFQEESQHKIPILPGPPT